MQTTSTASGNLSTSIALDWASRGVNIYEVTGLQGEDLPPGGGYGRGKEAAAGS